MDVQELPGSRVKSKVSFCEHTKFDAHLPGFTHNDFTPAPCQPTLKPLKSRVNTNPHSHSAYSHTLTLSYLGYTAVKRTAMPYAESLLHSLCTEGLQQLYIISAIHHGIRHVCYDTMYDTTTTRRQEK